MLKYFIERQHYWLNKLNQSRHIIYANDFERCFPGRDKTPADSQRLQQLAEHGFKLLDSGNSASYCYEGPNPASALEQLLTVDPLYMECKRASVLVEHLSLKDVVGSAKFNEIIRVFFNNKLSFEFGYPFREETHCIRSPDYFWGPYETLPIPTDVPPGSWIYLLGHPLAFGFHPTATLNAHNILCVAPSQFQGFDSTPDSPKTQEEFLGKMMTDYQQPLTYDDLSIIFMADSLATSPLENPMYSPLSRKDIYREIFEQIEEDEDEDEDDEDKNDALAALLAFTHQNLNKRSQSSICVPAAFQRQPPYGVVTIDRMHPDLFHALITGDKASFGEVQRRTKTAHYQLIPSAIPSFSRTIQLIADFDFPEFEQKNPHQINVIDELRYFCDTVLSRASQTSSGGLALYGAAGAEKISVCHAAIRALEENRDVTVWKWDVNQLNLDESFYSSLKQRPENDSIQEVIRRVTPIWDEYDVLYCVYNNDEHAARDLWLIKAALEYARLNNKKILLTSDPPIFDIVPDLLNHNFIRVVEVKEGQHLQRVQRAPSAAAQFSTATTVTYHTAIGNQAAGGTQQNQRAVEQAGTPDTEAQAAKRLRTNEGPARI